MGIGQIDLTNPQSVNPHPRRARLPALNYLPSITSLPVNFQRQLGPMLNRVLFAVIALLSIAGTAAPQGAPRTMLDTYCVTCHNAKLKTAGLALDTIDISKPSTNAEIWEKVVEKLRAGSMPPPGRPRPDAATYRATAIWLENQIDKDWLTNPNPGRIGAVHRLNRTEYNNAIRDLLKLDVDVKSQLPGRRCHLIPCMKDMERFHKKCGAV